VPFGPSCSNPVTSCWSPQVPCVSGAPDQVSDDKIPIPCLQVSPPPRPSAHTTAASPADSDDELPIPRLSHRPALVSCYGDVALPPLRPRLSRLCSSTSPPIVCPQPAPKAARCGRCPLGLCEYRFASSSSSSSSRAVMSSLQ
jgi:hypothetical protein